MICPVCRGNKTVEKTTYLLGFIPYTRNVPCTRCSGIGRVPWVAPPPPSFRTPDERLLPTGSRPGTSRAVHSEFEYDRSARDRRRREDDNDGSPLTAALVAGAMGGDPLVAAETTFFTGSTGLGILAGELAQNHQTSEPTGPQIETDNGSSFGGAGAGANWNNDQSVAQPVDQLPVIVDPFAAAAASDPQASEPATTDDAAASDSTSPASDDSGTSY